MTINFNDITDTATPSTGNFSVGGNAIVKGSGQNLLTYSNGFSTNWSNTSSAETLTASQADPFGGSTATLMVPTTTNTIHNLFLVNNQTLATGAKLH